MISQGGTIARFIAHECGLQGKDQHSRLIADMVFDALMDVRETVIAPMYHAREDETKQVEQHDSLHACFLSCDSLHACFLSCADE